MTLDVVKAAVLVTLAAIVQVSFVNSFELAEGHADILLLSLVALGLIVLSAWLAWRQWGFGTAEPPHDDPTAQDRRKFQGFATLLLSGLSFVAVIYVALPALFILECAR